MNRDEVFKEPADFGTSMRVKIGVHPRWKDHAAQGEFRFQAALPAARRE